MNSTYRIYLNTYQQLRDASLVEMYDNLEISRLVFEAKPPLGMDNVAYALVGREISLWIKNIKYIGRITEWSSAGNILTADLLHNYQNPPETND